ncbi:MAG: hypothetical protein AB8U25_00845 [Rickettsiales endosymbiont of Dermacentor nuttalli]
MFSKLLDKDNKIFKECEKKNETETALLAIKIALIVADKSLLIHHLILCTQDFKQDFEDY